MKGGFFHSKQFYPKIDPRNYADESVQNYQGAENQTTKMSDQISEGRDRMKVYKRKISFVSYNFISELIHMNMPDLKNNNDTELLLIRQPRKSQDSCILGERKNDIKEQNDIRNDHLTIG